MGHDVEVIVVDNASTDGTKTACSVVGESLFGKKNFAYIRQEIKQNSAQLCNIGAKSAKGELLFFLDNDAILNDNWLPPLLAALESLPYPAVLG